MIVGQHIVLERIVDSGRDLDLDVGGVAIGHLVLGLGPCVGVGCLRVAGRTGIGVTGCITLAVAGEVGVGAATTPAGVPWSGSSVPR